MKRLSKFEIIIGILGSMLLLPLVGFYAICVSMFAPCKALNMEVEKELSRIRAEGEPVSLEELAPPLIPEDENAAFIYKKAFQKMEEIPWEVIDLLWKRPSELTFEKRAALRDFLHKNEEVFFLLDQAMTYEKCRFPIDYKKGYLAEILHLSKLRGCARLLALKSLQQLDEGNAEEAISTSLKMIKLSNSVSTEPFLISQLVRIAIGSMMINSLEKILAEGEVPVETLRRLIDTLNTFKKEVKDGLRPALLGERCEFIAIFEDPEKLFFGMAMHEIFLRLIPPMFEDPEEFPFLVDALVGTLLLLRKGADIIPWNRLGFLMDSRFVRNDLLHGLRIHREFIDFTHLPFYQAIREIKELKTEIDKHHDEIREAGKLRPWRLVELHIVSEMILPSMSRGFTVWAHHEAEINQARIAAALELYKREHNVYPEHLRDIPSHILSPLPKDPFIGEDFIYRRENGDFTLYSVGENLKDDGGIAFIRTEEKEKERADIVWGK